MNYYEPDNTWEVFGINSKEEFVEKFVVPGKFHSEVPADVVKSFETVTHLLALSYYYYPLYEEALSKALLVMEMAVKIKAIEEGIDLKLPPNKKGIIYDKKLWKVIEEVCDNPHLSFLRPEFDRARGLRNYKMHPDRHSLVGIVSKANANSHLFINIINLLFSSKDSLEDSISTQASLFEILPRFKNGLFVLDYGQKILIVDVHTLRFVKGNKRSLLLLYINPVYSNVKKVFSEKKYPDPLLLSLNQYNINDKTLEGVDVLRGKVRIYPTDKSENIGQWYRYSEELQQLSNSDIEMYNSVNSNRVLWQMERMIYNHCWEEGKINEPH